MDTARLLVRDRLMSAAEALFATQGVDVVSLRDILAAASAGNASAIQYHFGDRVGLILAVLGKHRPAVESRRHALLDHYEAEGRDDLRALAGAFVRPLADELTADGGPGYLRTLSDLANRPQPMFDPGILADPADSTNRWRSMVEQLISVDAVRLHRRFAAIQFTYNELARRSRDAAGANNRLYVSHLVDLVTAILAAPLSNETQRLLPSQRWPKRNTSAAID